MQLKLMKALTTTLGQVMFGAAMVILTVINPVHAADKGGQGSSILPLGELSKAASASWSGFYFSGGVGYGWQSTEVSGDGKLDGKSFDLDNGLATLGFGWNYQFGNMVAGLMADATLSNLDASYKSKSVYDVDWQWFVGARLGVLVAPRILAYGLAGYTHQEGDTFDFSSVASGKDRTLRDFNGLTLGAGAEAMLDDKWTMRMEYRWVNGGSGDVNIPNDGSGKLQELETDIHQVRLVATYRFSK